MKAKLVNLEKSLVSEISLNDSIFGLEGRGDLIKRVIDWQRAKARSGTHSVKTVGEVSGTTKKPFKQKGTGNARQGNARGVQRRGGGVAHGPCFRSHATKLQKKVRKLGLKNALSVKFAAGNIHFIDSLNMLEPKTKVLSKLLSRFGQGRFFIIDSKTIDRNLQLSASAIPEVIVMPAIGVNVYDLINSDNILISQSALLSLEERLG